jgi:3-oxoacyl-[acyl-carrier-protein] synthase-3
MTHALATTTGAQFARIMSVASYRPERIVTNAEICERIDSSDEWIRERSGIIERRWARPDESVVDMGRAAAITALERAGIDPAQIDMLVMATVTHPFQTPSAAAVLSHQIGTVNAAAMDISAACAGFCYGIGLASDMIRAGSATYVLVIGVEKLSEWVNLDDRSSAFLFADGAGAVVVGPSDVNGIGPVVWGADGSQSQAITMTQSLIDFRDAGGDFPTLVMQGQQVFRWAVSEIAKVCQRALDAAGIAAQDLDAFIPHQANMRITDAMIKAMALPSNVPVARDIQFTGNTSAASIPLAMDRMLTDGEAPHGGTALLVGFGAGLVYAAQVVTLP